MQDLPVQGFWVWLISLSRTPPISDKLDVYCSDLQQNVWLMSSWSSLHSACHLGLFFSRKMYSEWIWGRFMQELNKALVYLNKNLLLCFHLCVCTLLFFCWQYGRMQTMMCILISFKPFYGLWIHAEGLPPSPWYRNFAVSALWS